MNNSLILILVFFSLNAFGQKNPTAEAQPIVAEGKLLYKSEMASWYGTDLFLEKYKDRANIGGYFSYPDSNVTKCIFFSAANIPQVIGTIAFDSSYNVKTAKIDMSERAFTTAENDLYQIRKIASEALDTNTDKFFKFYQNTNPNIIPLISEQEKKVYILTGPQKNGVVIFGNDYLLTFDKDNNLISKKQLHKNIIPIEYGKEEEGITIESTIHSHLPETGDFITATDICTLMLYGKIAKWKTHHVVSQKYLNIWNCETSELTVITKEAMDKIYNDGEKRNGGNNE